MRTFTRRTTTIALLGALAIGSSLPAAAESGRVQKLTHRQSILTELSSTGEAGTSRVFTQLTATGTGPVTVALPNQSTAGLRSLDGFGGPDVDGDEVIYTLDAAATDGGHARTVADNTAELPVSVAVTYLLDGEEIDPDDLAGRDGQVSVQYTVRNLTAEPREIVSFDAENNKVVETMDVAVPMVGSLSLTLPSNFANVDAPGAVTAGDGRGNTVVNFSLLLFAPLGAEEQVVTWTADAADTVIPATSLQVLPVDDRSFGSLSSTADAYKGATKSLGDLANGALIIDSNLQLLGSGASQLLDGLNQLSDGADQLSDGLANTAAPGARQLSDGLSKAREGGGKLATGLGELGLGANRLSAGLGDALAGGSKLSSGLGQLASGAGELRGGSSTLAAGAATLNEKTGDLAAGTLAVAKGASGLLDGLETLRGSLNDPEALPKAIAGVTTLNDAVKRLSASVGGEADSAAAGDRTLLGGINDLRAGLTGRIAPGTEALKQLTAGMNASFGPDDDGLDAGERAAKAAGALESAQNLLGAIRGSGAAPGSFDYAAVSGDYVCLNPACSATATVEEILVTGKPAVNIPPGGLLTAILGSVRTGMEENAASLGTLPADCDAAKAAAGATDPDGLAVILAASCVAAELDAGIDGLIVPGVAQIRAGVSNPTALTPGTGHNPTCQPATAENGLQPCGVLQALQLISGGLSNPTCDPTDPTNPCGLSEGLSGALAAVNAGLGDRTAGDKTLIGGAALLSGGAAQLRDGAAQLRRDGTAPLASGAAQLDAGAAKLLDGAKAASNGSKDLASGLGQLADGGGQLATGAGTAASGARDLASGLIQLDDGADKLADGLGDAADGSTKLAEGLTSAEEGGGKLADGTAKLQEGFEGQLIAGISGGRQGASLDYEQVRAVIARGREGAAPYGIAQGADASTVFQFDVAGVGAEEGPSTPLLVVLALGTLAVAGGLGVALRRRLAV